MNQVNSTRAVSLTECLPPDQARQLIELLRPLSTHPTAHGIEIRDDAGSLLGYFIPEAAPVADSPAFYEELRRRMESPEPALPVETFLAELETLRRTSPSQPRKPEHLDV